MRPGPLSPRAGRAQALLLLLAALAGLGAPAGCGGASRRRPDRPRILAAELGLDGVLRPGRWATARIEIGHPGPRTFEGTVEVVAEGIERGAFSARVHLPAGARQRVVIPFLCPSTGVALELRDAGGRTVDAPDLRSQLVSEDEVVVAVLGPVPAGLRRLAAQTTARPKVIVAALEPATAPSMALGYEPADLVLWPEPSPGALEETAREAVLEHLRGGGRWLITLGPGAPDLARSALAADLPARIIEVEDVELEAAAGEPLGLVETGGRRAQAARLHLTALEPRDGATVLARTADRAARPLVVHGAAGLGELTLVAVPASLPGRAESAAAAAPATLPGATGSTTAPGQIWRALVGASNVSSSSAAATASSSSAPSIQQGPFAGRTLATSRHVLSQSHGTLTSTLEKDLQVPPLSLAGVLLALVVYLLVIGPIDYLVLRRLGRLEWTWLTYPVAVLVFAIGVTLWGQSSRGSQWRATRLDFVELLEPAGSTAAGRYRARSYLALYTPSKGERRLGLRGGQGQRHGLVAPSGIAGRRTSGARLLRAQIDGPDPHALLSTHASAVSFLEARWTGTLGTGDAPMLRLQRVGGTGSGAGELRVQSRLPFPLDQAWLVTPDGRTLPLGRLPPGGSAQVSLTAPVAGGDAVQLAQLTLGPGHALPPRPGLPGGHVLLGRRSAVEDELRLDGQPTGTHGQLLLRAPLSLDGSSDPDVNP